MDLWWSSKDGGLDAFRGETGSVRKAYVIGEAARFATQDCESVVSNAMSDAVHAAFKRRSRGYDLIGAGDAALTNMIILSSAGPVLLPLQNNFFKALSEVETGRCFSS